MNEGCTIGFVDAGEWLKYTVDVQQTGDYVLTLRTARGVAGNGSLHIEVDGVSVTGQISIPPTATWDTQTTLTGPAINLTKGTHTIRVYFDTGLIDFNWMEFQTETTPPPPFDFSLTSSQSSLSVTQGQSTSNTVTATLTSGSAQSVSFSASGLPTGSTYAFSPTSCSPTCLTGMGIATGNTTPAGTYTITVSASSGAITKTTSFTLIVLAPQGQSTKFLIGDRVQTTANLKARSCPSTSCQGKGTHKRGETGIVIGGPTIADGYTWYNIDYDTGTDGWSVEDYLVKATATVLGASTTNEELINQLQTQILKLQRQLEGLIGR